MPNSRSGLLWLAALLLIAGLAIAYVLWQDVTSPDAHRHGVLVLTIFAALSGICVICATAPWWLKR